MPKRGNQKEFLKLSKIARFYRWVTRDPAEDMLPMLTIGIFAVVIGVILIALSVGFDENLVIVGAMLSIIGCGVVAMALVLSALKRGKSTGLRTYYDRKKDDQEEEES